MNKKPKKYVLDTSAILSGKPIDLGELEIVTTPRVSDELTIGGRDYQNFQYLKEKGLNILAPNKDVIDEVKRISDKTGDKFRLSKTDIERPYYHRVRCRPGTHESFERFKIIGTHRGTCAIGGVKRCCGIKRCSFTGDDQA